jgi:hypothetical protein
MCFGLPFLTIHVVCSAGQQSREETHVVMEPRQVTNTVLETRQVTNTVMETQQKVLPVPPSGLPSPIYPVTPPGIRLCACL